jgi:hypothetical protein
MENWWPCDEADERRDRPRSCWSQHRRPRLSTRSPLPAPGFEKFDTNDIQPIDQLAFERGKKKLRHARFRYSRRPVRIVIDVSARARFAGRYRISHFQ